MLELLIKQHVFLVNNKEKVNILKARDETRTKLVTFKEYLLQEIENIKK